MISPLAAGPVSFRNGSPIRRRLGESRTGRAYAMLACLHRRPALSRTTIDPVRHTGTACFGDQPHVAYHRRQATLRVGLNCGLRGPGFRLSAHFEAPLAGGPQPPVELAARSAARTRTITAELVEGANERCWHCCGWLRRRPLALR